MNNHSEKRSLENFKNSALSKKQAEKVNGAFFWLSPAFGRNPVKSTINYVCYGNVNGIENRRW